ncbi:MAG: GntR family transcriptional regulator [Candidatus Aminicenantes bacterium]|jgi:DNA-binding GntR family transcriptional regulator|nr:GntR family transcriptional regulator [Candidatus Aminicenantes bacterium]
MISAGKKPLLNIRSLKEQVYEYIREEMHKGHLLPGSVINMDETSRMLGVSKTPLRDALLQLEMESFVTILPRRGVIVNPLSFEDIKNYYEIIGALESTALFLSRDNMKEATIKSMEKLCEGMRKALAEDNFDLYYDRNLKFHNTYLGACGNEALVKIVNNLKKRLYDFPRPESWLKEWEVASCGEHETLLEHLRQGRFEEAARFIRDVHWSYRVQERFIVRYYARAAGAGSEAPLKRP